MSDYLTTREVQDLLKVDRITIYRMVQDGRLHGVKIGQQWRFADEDVQRLICRASAPAAGEEPALTAGAFPVHCAQVIQDLFSDLGQISSLIIDLEGRPLTQTSHPCAFCQQENQVNGGACQEAWTKAASAPYPEKPIICHAGFNYIRTPIQINGQTLAWLLVSQNPQPPASETSSASPARLEEWSQRFVQAMESIIKERTRLVDRLQQIARISQLEEL
ncbi:MAG TPA: PocR ligand-binding domain-containing protein [Anaerolineaceae bacterium]|nr:PocR ligand-binding domain-containing protein [Anaerolineaceae bacterium]HPN49987.1 PocR ligand-binding domain-containing protein [Anaerolineaceae bacterium]